MPAIEEQQQRQRGGRGFGAMGATAEELKKAVEEAKTKTEADKKKEEDKAKTGKALAVIAGGAATVGGITFTALAIVPRKKKPKKGRRMIYGVVGGLLILVGLTTLIYVITRPKKIAKGSYTADKTKYMDANGKWWDVTEELGKDGAPQTYGASTTSYPEDSAAIVFPNTQTSLEQLATAIDTYASKHPTKKA